MEQLLLWEKFKKTGRIEDYLKYVHERERSEIYKNRCLENKAR